MHVLPSVAAELSVGLSPLSMSWERGSLWGDIETHEANPGASKNREGSVHFDRSGEHLRSSDSTMADRPPRSDGGPPRGRFDERHVLRLAAFARHENTAAAWRLVVDLRRAGTSTDELLSGLLTRAAKRLDEGWRSDECTFLEVTLGVCQLRTLALRLVSSIPMALANSASGRCAAMLAPAGDRLSFTPILHQCYLEMRGWRVEKLEGLELATVLQHVQAFPVDLALFVLHDPSLMGRVHEAVRNLRKRSRNPDLRVLGLGQGFDHSGMVGAGLLDAQVQSPDDTLAFLSSLPAA